MFALLPVVVVIAGLTPQETQKIEASITGAARPFYENWKKDPKDDVAAMKILMGPKAIEKVTQSMVACISAPQTCVDAMTCRAGPARLQSLRLLPTSTKQEFQAELTLAGPGPTVLWTMRAGGELGAQLVDVKCGKATPSAGGAPPKDNASFQSKVEPKNEAEATVLLILRDTIGVSDDDAIIRALKIYYSSEGIDDYKSTAKACLSNAQQGHETYAGCDGNLIVCGEGSGRVTSLSSTEGPAGIEVEAFIQLAKGGKRRASFRFDKKLKVKSHFCEDPDEEYVPLGVDSSGKSLFGGHCTGLASCGGSCSYPCYRGLHGTCMGSPPPCDGRAPGQCHSGCQWVPDR